MCDTNPIEYSFVDGIENPADLMNKPNTWKKLKSSNYIEGPSFLRTREDDISRIDVMAFSIPNNKHRSTKLQSEITEVAAA